MTQVTRAQLGIGQEVSRSLENFSDFVDVTKKCLEQDRDWRRYAAKELADRTANAEALISDLSEAVLERKVFRIWRDGNHEAAIAAITRFLEKENLDNATRGWLLQYSARIAANWGNNDLSADLQRRAFLSNRSLLRPRTVVQYSPISVVDDQVQAIFDRLKTYAFRRGVLQEFDDAVEPLLREASSNRAEAALDRLAALLGFTSERPDKRSTGGLGPDLPWFLTSTKVWIIEAKTRKLNKNAFNKEDHGQLLVAREWFNKTYPKNYESLLVSLVPSGRCTEASQANEVRGLNTKILHEVITQAREAYDEISHAPLEGDALKHRISQILQARRLDAAQIYKYLQSLQVG